MRLRQAESTRLRNHKVPPAYSRAEESARSLDGRRDDDFFKRKSFSSQAVSRFILLDVVFDGHVFEFAGLKNFAAFQAFDKFSVLFSGYDAHTRMPAKLFRRVLLGGWTWAWWILARLHIRTMAHSARAGWRIAGIVSLSRRLSSLCPVNPVSEGGSY